ncbi:MAG TPA: hypothetical protein VIH48_02605, partial [Candidatus Bathyarchaeia archaeon]
LTILLAIKTKTTLKNRTNHTITVALKPTLGIAANNSPLAPIPKPIEKIKTTIAPKTTFPKSTRFRFRKAKPNKTPATNGTITFTKDVKSTTARHQSHRLKNSIFKPLHKR